MQTFLKVHEQTKYSFFHYLLTLVVVVLCYGFIGNIPLVAAYFMGEYRSPDIIYSLKQNYGLNISFALMLLPLVTSFFGLVLSVKYIHKRKVLSVFTGKTKFAWKRLFFSFVTWTLVNFVIFLISFNDKIEWNYMSVFWPLFLMALVLIPLQCAAEELLFRGILWQWLGKFIPKAWVVILLTGISFGVLHVANPEIVALGKIALVYYIWVGVFLGVLTYIDNGLELPLGYHIANNLFATLIVTTNWQVFQTNALYIDTNPPAFTFTMMLQMIAGQVVLLGLYYLLFKRNQIRGKA